MTAPPIPPTRVAPVLTLTRRFSTVDLTPRQKATDVLVRSIDKVKTIAIAPGDALPASWDDAIEALTGPVRDLARRDPVVLVGYSIGGALAHAVARRLEEEGIGPAGVVMIDTYVPVSDAENRQVLADAVGAVLSRQHEMTPIGDDELVATGKFVRLLPEFKPEPIESPALLIRAREQLGDAFDAGRLASWQLPEDIVEVAGDHIALIEDAAGAPFLRRRA